jgi:multiple sugar transport system substrate-binding protein
MTMFRRVFLGSLATTMLLGVACTPSSPAQPTAGSGLTPAAAKPAGEPVTLRFSTWGNDQHVALLQQLTAKYTARNPNVTVEVLSIPASDYQQKLTVQFAGGDAPDVGWVAERMAPQFIDSNALVDMAAPIKTDAGFNVADFSPGAMGFWTRGERIYGLPFSTPPSIVFFNRTLFMKAGIPAPDELEKQGKWTWDEYARSAKTIAEKASSGGDRTYGALLVRNNDWKDWSGIYALLYAYGAQVLTPDGKYAMNTPEAARALDLYQDLIKSGAHPKAGEQIVFEGGKVGLFHDVMSYLSKARTIKDFEWGMVAMPKGPAGRVPMLGMAGYSVFRTSKNQAAAIEFAKYMASTEAMNDTSAFFTPPRQSVLNSPVFLKPDGVPAPDVLKATVVDQMPLAKAAPAHAKWVEIDTVVRNRLDTFYAGGATGQQTVEGIGKDLEPILGKS